ncbi:zinc ribbon domain-containing protein [Streptomyces sp. 8N706]|uniref:zinc ribbon domain-containing protein n=1 Tax=Streptomyces sp. 8N706 TaxID=3457416 RepID=UPI003FD0E6CF
MPPFCPTCGAQRPAEARFCMGCGRETPAQAGGAGPLDESPTITQSAAVPDLLHTPTLASAAPPPSPPPPYGAATRPKPARSRLLTWGALVLAAFVVGGAATAGVLVLRGGDGGAGPGGGSDSEPLAVKSEEPAVSRPGVPTTGPTPSDPPSLPSQSPPSPSAEATTAAEAPSTPPGLPANYRMVHDPQGFSLGVFELWQREVNGGQIDYRGSTGNSYLRIGIRVTSQSSRDHFLELEEIVRRKSDGYRRLELAGNTFRGRPGARWEFVWTEKGSGRTMHAVDQSYVTEDGTEYAIYFQDWHDSWSVSRESFDIALDTWSAG